MLQPLDWSAPRATGYASIGAQDGEHARWRVTPVPRDVCRIHYHGRDSDGTVVAPVDHQAYAESVAEAKIVVDILRAGTDHLPSWRDQLEAAGFVRTYPDGEGSLSSMWHDRRSTGRYQVTVFDAYVREGEEPETSVHAIYESNRSTFWHNVCYVDAGIAALAKADPRMRDGLPEGVDALKAGVAAAIAIRDARQARGGRFATPLAA